MNISGLICLVIFTVVLAPASACAQNTPVPKKEPKANSFSTDEFDISLEDSWKQRVGAEFFEWEDTGTMEEIIISTMRIEKSMERALMSSTADRLLEHRLSALREISKGKANFEKVEKIEGVDQIEIRLRGLDPNDEMQIYTAVIVRPTHAITFAYYKYAPLFSDDEFRRRSNGLREKLKVK